MYRRASVSVTRLQRGLTLIELMIALAIGLVIVAAVSVLFASGSKSRREIELSADVNENGRYALDVLSRELSQTGFYGSLVKPTAAATRIPADMTVATAMCLTGPANLAAWKDSLTYNVLGLGGAAGANIDADPSCIERKAGTDALFIQRASTCAVGDPNCPAESNADAFLQVSECGTEYSTTPFVLGRGGTGTSTFTLQTKTCAGTAAPKRKLVRRIYYVSAANELSYQDMPLSGGLPAPVVLVENIEQLQIEYAFDTSNPSDGTPDLFAAAPDPLAVPPTDWTQVIGVRIWLLARSSDPSRYTKNAANFVLGGDTTVSVTASAAGNPKRRVYSTYISFITPKARSES